MIRPPPYKSVSVSLDSWKIFTLCLKGTIKFYMIIVNFLHITFGKAYGHTNMIDSYHYLPNVNQCGKYLASFIFMFCVINMGYVMAYIEK